MTEEERDSVAESVRLFMAALAGWIAPLFPYQAAGITQEIGRPRMTTDRWNRVAAVLASLHAIPGVALAPGEHDVRNVALGAIPVAQKMAAACLGCAQDPDGCREFAAWRSAQIALTMRGREEKG